MLDATGFEMAEVVGESELEAHPVWAPFERPEDAELIESWGVASDRIEGERTRLERCGTQPMFPVLQTNPLPSLGGLVLAARSVCSGGTELSGYVIGKDTFGLFVHGKECCFNRLLPEAAAREIARACDALGLTPADVFPLRYETGLVDADGRELAGVFASP